MSKITILKSSINLDKDIKEIKQALKRAEKVNEYEDKIRNEVELYSFELIKSNSIDITDKEIKKQASLYSQELEDGFLACWEFIKAKLI